MAMLRHRSTPAKRVNELATLTLVFTMQIAAAAVLFSINSIPLCIVLCKTNDTPQRSSHHRQYNNNHST